jgi:prepilin signal peptidase PulO-like enzyme (type II secretory pathway)
MFEAAPTLGPMTLSVFVGAALGWLALIAARLYAAQLQATLQPLECAEETEKLIAIPDGSSSDHHQWLRELIVGASLGSALAAALVLRFSISTELALAAVLTLGLLVLTVIDQRHMLLPDSLTLPLVWLGLLCNIPGYFTNLQDAVIGAVLGYGSLWSIYWLFKLVRGKEGLGYGDFKLTAALGSWLGWQALPGIIFTAALVGACIGLAQVIIKKRQRDQPLPFGPFLAAAGFVVLCTGWQGPWLLSV